MAYQIENGLFWMENLDTIVIPCMDEDYDGSLDFDRMLSPFVNQEFIGDFTLSATLTGRNVSLGDSFGIYAYKSEEEYAYVSLASTKNGRRIVSGGFDIFEMKNPEVEYCGKSIRLIMDKKDNKFSFSFVNENGENTEIGNIVLDDSIFMKVGFGIKSFSGSELIVSVTDIKID